jgi:hypothetical protein
MATEENTYTGTHDGDVVLFVVFQIEELRAMGLIEGELSMEQQGAFELTAMGVEIYTQMQRDGWVPPEDEITAATNAIFDMCEGSLRFVIPANPKDD